MTARLRTGPLIVLVVVLLAFVTGAGGIAIVMLGAAVACLARAARRRGRLRLAWTALGLAPLTGVLGAGTGSAVGLGYLAMLVPAMIGLLLLPMPRQAMADRFRVLVDAAMIAVALLSVSWNLVVQPVLAAGRPGPAGPVADVALCTVALVTASRLRAGVPDVAALRRVCSALLIIGVADSAGARATLGGLPAAGWYAGFAMILLAAARADDTRPSRSGRRPDERRTAALIPYAVVVLALVHSLLWLALDGSLSAVGSTCRSALTALVIVRQVLIMTENRRLARRLEARVDGRTAELQVSERRFRALVEQSSESLAIVDADSTVLYQSESIERIFGFPAALFAGRRLDQLGDGDAGLRVRAAIAEVLPTRGATTNFQLMLRHADGRERLAEMTITNLLDDPNVRGLVFNTRDISEAQELQEKLRHEAYHDGLTGLVNRALFRERLAAAAGGERLAILFLDLDGFKQVNDSLGHAAGDQLLIQLAARLREHVPAGHTVARLGGDEFAVVVESANARADAETIAADLLDALEMPFLVDGRELHVGAAIGLASAVDAADTEQLQRNADLAMYRAKDAGGHVYAAYHPGMHDALVRRLELAADLRLALERDELILHYQPTVDLRTGEIAGFEALVRWQHPTRGMVPPLEFIGVAESTGLIVPLGRWVLTEACRQAVAWGTEPGRGLKMSVNVSVRQFDAGDLAATVAEVLAETGMPADRLCLEMTESVLLTDTDENLARIVSLKALGVLLAMDDFGTGYSSLAYLQRFPMDVLKIDRSFVDRLGAADEDDALVRTIVRLGRNFGMVLVAEGIETEAQLAALRAMDCDLAQGYLLSRPVPAAEAGRLLETGLALPVRA